MTNLLTKTLLLDAAAHLAPDAFAPGRQFMCNAVFFAAGGVLGDGDAAEAQFAELLNRHGISTSGRLTFEGHDYDPDQNGDSEAQALRFDFLNLLAVSGVR